MLEFIIFCFFAYCYKSVVSKKPSKQLQKQIDKRKKEKEKLNLWVAKHKAVASYNRKRNRTRSNSYGGKRRHGYDGYY